MIELSPEIIDKLRLMASAGATVSQLLRETIRRMPSNQQGTLYLVKYFREAFHLSLRSVAPIGGWDESGKGEITDERIEELLRPEMQQTRELWEHKENLQVE